MTSGDRRRMGLRDWSPLAALLAVFATVGVWNLDAYDLMNWDQTEYASLARSILNFEGYQISERPHFYRPFCWPASIATVMWAAGDATEHTAKITTLLYALAAISLVYLIVWRACGVWPAVIAGWSLAIYPEFAIRVVTLLSETAFMAFFLAALASFYMAFRRGGWWFYAGWGLWAAALSTRQTALLFGPILILVFAYEFLRDRANLIRVLRTRAFWLSPIVAVLILAPWHIRQELSHGSMFWGIRHAAIQAPTYSTEVMPWHFYFSQMPGALTWPGVILSVGGLLYGLFTRRPFAIYLACAIFVVVAWHTRYDYKIVRYVTAILPMLAVGAGFATAAWAERMGRGRVIAWLPPLLLLLSGTVTSARTAATHIAMENMNDGSVAFLAALRHLALRTGEDAVLLTRRQPQVYWYSGRRTILSPNSEERYRALLKEVDWVIMASFTPKLPDYQKEVQVLGKTLHDFGPEGRVFRSGEEYVMVLRPDWVLERLDEDAAGSAPRKE